MMPEHTPITGTIAANWAVEDPAIVMDNPLGGITRGSAAMQSVHERLFGGVASSGRILVKVDNVTTRKRNTAKLNQAGRRVMSHSKALSRLTVGGRSSDMFRWALRKGIDKFERDWTRSACAGSRRPEAGIHGNTTCD